MKGLEIRDLEAIDLHGAEGPINAFEAEILDHITGRTDYSPPTNWYIGASTTTPTETGTNVTEPVGGAYARIAVLASNSEWSAATPGAPSVADNINAILFATATGDWGTLTHGLMFTTSTGGTVQMWGALQTAKRIQTDDRLQIAAGAMDIKLGDPGDTYT